MSILKKKCYDIAADLAAFCKHIHGLHMYPRIYIYINNTYYVIRN